VAYFFDHAPCIVKLSYQV